MDEIREEKEALVDFSKIKDFFKRKNNNNIKSSFNFEILKNKKYLIPILLILIAMSFSIYFRIQSNYLPITDNWARDSVYNYYRNQIYDAINKEYPNLPEQNKNNLVNDQFQEFLKIQKSMINEQIKQVSQDYKSYFKNEEGQTYLLAIDPYLWYSTTRNYLNNGHFGTEKKLIDREEGNFLRNGRQGLPGEPGSVFHLYLGVYLYKFVNIFEETSLMTVFFYIPLIIVTLSVIPIFLIGKKIGGNIGGFFTATIFVINISLLRRTIAGFADTDAYSIFFPLIVICLIFEAYETKNFKMRLLYTSLAGLSIAFFCQAWAGWWYIFCFVLATISFLIIYNIIIRESIKKSVFIGTIFVFTSFIFSTLFGNFARFKSIFRAIFKTITMKEVGVVSLWPNVLTTVAEFNEIPIGTIISELGGKLLFLLSILGIILTLLIKDKNNKRDLKYFILLTIWFIGASYGYTKGMRFAILIVPTFAIAFGACIGIIYKYLNNWIINEMHINKYITEIIMVILFLLLLINPLEEARTTAINSIPGMNDIWYNSLIGIKEDSQDAIITSWWDFGHWFVAIAERRVTFDGADQGERIYWVGKSLLTNNEKEAIGILRMLNCAQEEAPHVLEKYLNKNTVKSINILNRIILEDREEAIKILKTEGLSNEEIIEVLSTTHCDDLIPQYYITSEDMVGKAGVWSHFGSWDFERAKMWQNVRKLDIIKGTKILKEEFGLNDEEADNIYYEIKNNRADQWISPWPGYLTGINKCTEGEGIIKCENNIEINLTDMRATVLTQQGKILLKSISFINEYEEFEIRVFNESSADFSVALIPFEDGFGSILMSEILVGSMFTRMFFFDGYGLEYFKLFSNNIQPNGGKIQVWKVDLE